MRLEAKPEDNQPLAGKEQARKYARSQNCRFVILDKLRKAAAVDRRVTLREILEKVFDLIPGFKSKDELLEEEFDKFVAI